MKHIDIYRIENPDTMHGMWYTLNAEWEPFIFTLTDGRSKDLPMGKHPRYAKGGKKWFSAGKNIHNMNQWFSPLDAYELHNSGYKVFRFRVSEYQMEDMQCLFTREGVIEQEHIPLEFIWDLTEVKK